MRVRYAHIQLELFNKELRRRGHPFEDPYARAMRAQFWQKFTSDRKIARGEL